NHNCSLGQKLIHVPLLLFGVGVDVGAGRVATPVSLLWLRDWLTTLAEGAIEEPASEGPVRSEYESTARHNGIPDQIREALDAGRIDRVPPMLFHPGLAVLRGDLKYITTDEGEEYLYDLARDPGEEHDLAPSAGEALVSFRPEREGWLARRATQPLADAGDVAEG